MPANQGTFKQPIAWKRVLEELFANWFKDFELQPGARNGNVDFLLRVGSTSLLLEVKNSSDTVTIDDAAQQVLQYVTKKGDVPVVAVPFMGEAGRQVCARHGVSWLDLSGNADITAPNLRIVVDGKPNRYVQRGRPTTPFAPKSSRIARRLLLEPKNWFTQRELAKLTSLDPSQVSRVIGRLKQQRLVKADDRGRITWADRRRMLEAWNEAYSFDQHSVLRAHMPSRSGLEATRRLAQYFESQRVRYAITGLGAAWEFSHVANYRLSTVYVVELPRPAELSKLDMVAQSTGSNVWLVVPNDEGVFDGTRRPEAFDCVHPVQAWLDLKSQPERSAEAATVLLAQILTGEFDG